MHLRVVLDPSDPSGLQSLLRALYDPSSVEFHRWLTPVQFQARFGPSAATVAEATSWLRGAGLTPSTLSGFALDVSATAGQVEAALSTPLESYRTTSGVRGYLPHEAPLVPVSLSGQIAGIVGLDTLQQFTPTSVAPSATATPEAALPDADGLTPCTAAQDEATAAGGYTLDQLGADYGINSLLADGQNGTGETIALYELASHSSTDVSTYQSCFGLTNSVSTVQVDGGGGTVGGSGTAEADLDIEQAMTQAPDASIISYEGPNTATGTYDTWSSIVSNSAVKVVSTSWGTCEPLFFPDSSAYTPLFEQAASQGQTILAATGDSGSEGCYAADRSTEEEVTYPASDPYVTAVGGTSLVAPGDETAWNYCQSDESTACANDYEGQAAGGGGMSRYESRPSYQPNILYWSVAQSCGQYCRELPDLSANAGIPMVIYANGAWIAGAGTSFAAPFVAGLVADANAGCSSTVGQWTPGLYALAADGSYGSAFNDITSGNIDMTGTNGGAFPATSGYDAATGIGSPIAGGLSCPEVTGVQPSTASAGSAVTVTGLGLEHASIEFGGIPAQVVSASETQASVIVPDGSGSVPVGGSSVLGTGTGTASFTFSLPSPPASVSAQGGSEQVTVSWTAVAGADSYRVFESSSSGGESYSGPAGCSASAPATDCAVGGLTNGTPYFFTVEAVNAAGVSSPSSETSASPFASPYVAVEGPGHSLLLYWRTSDAQWHGPLGIGGPGSTFASPAIMTGPNGLPYVAVEGPANTTWLYWETADAQWHGPLQVAAAGSTFSGPAIAPGPDGLPDVVVQGPSGSLWLYWETADAQWHGPLGIGGPGSTYSSPAVIQGSNGLPFVAAQGPGQSLWIYWETPDAQWHGPYGIAAGGSTFSAPALALGPNGLPEVVAQGPAESTWFYWQTSDAQWHGPYGIGAPGTDFATPSIAATGPEGLPAVAVEGPGDSLWLYWQSADAQWHGPYGAGPGGSTFSSPSIAVGTDGLPMIAARGPGDGLWLYWQTADAQWHGPLGVGGPQTTYSPPGLVFQSDPLPF